MVLCRSRGPPCRPASDMLAVHRAIEGVELRQSRDQGADPGDGLYPAGWRRADSPLGPDPQPDDRRVRPGAFGTRAGAGRWSTCACQSGHRHEPLWFAAGRSDWFPAFDLRPVAGYAPGRPVHPFCHRRLGSTRPMFASSWQSSKRCSQARAQAGFDFPLVHAANSAATMRLPEAHFDAVRPGIAMYGMDPSSEWPPVFEIRPALTPEKPRQPGAHAAGGCGGKLWPHLYHPQADPGSPGAGGLWRRFPPHAFEQGRGAGPREARSHSSGGCAWTSSWWMPAASRMCSRKMKWCWSGSKGTKRIRAEEVAALPGTINYEVTTALLPRGVCRFTWRRSDGGRFDCRLSSA